MYILTFKPFVDIFSFSTLMECLRSGDTYIYEDKESLKNGIISACPIYQRNMKVYKLFGHLEDIGLDNIKPFNGFDRLIIDKHVIFNENCISDNPVSSLMKLEQFKRFIVNFYTDENNRSTIIFILYTDTDATEKLNDAGVNYIEKNIGYHVFLKSEEDIYELLMYLSMNDVEIDKNSLKYFSFDNYTIKCKNITLE